jgi:hypothetical protein
MSAPRLIIIDHVLSDGDERSPSSSPKQTLRDTSVGFATGENLVSIVTSERP